MGSFILFILFDMKYLAYIGLIGTIAAAEEASKKMEEPKMCMPWVKNERGGFCPDGT